MIDTVYVEQAVADHPRTGEVLARLPQAQVVECAHFSELFNARRQNFRLQKQRPGLILARKSGDLLHEVPHGYGVGSERNWYFSHLFNCPYDCSYCFLQGMFRSANYVLFVDYERFFDEIAQIAKGAAALPESTKPWFFSGYDCDSLALDGLTRFTGLALDRFAELPDARLELRTKSTQTRALLSREALPNVVVAFSLSPSRLADAREVGAPSLDRRLRAANQLASAGWQIGWRFDPVVWFASAAEEYAQLLEQVAQAVPSASIHSTTLGALRLPPDFYRQMSRLMPADALLASLERDQEGSMSYPARVREELLGPLADQIVQLWGEERFFPILGDLE